MPVTTKGKRWEILHSLWIGWTFTFGFFNWVAFLYIGFRAKQRKWILWGLFYGIPFVLAMLNPNLNNWLGDVTMILIIVLGVVGIFHAFKVRKEYLRLLEAAQVTSRGVESVDETGSHRDLGKQLPAPGDHFRTPRSANSVLLPYEDLFRVCAEYAGDGYYVGEAIGQKRLTIAHTRFPIPETERVIALIDTSMLRRGKTGLALGEGGVYWRNDWTAPKTYKTSLSWAEFAAVSITFKDKPANTVELGKGNNFTVTNNDIKKEDLSELLSEVQSLARRSVGENQGTTVLGQSDRSPAETKHSEPERRTESDDEVHTTPSSPETTSASAEASRQTARSHTSADSVAPPILSGDELEYQISSSYPFPIAFGFRSLMSIVDYRDLYREQLRISENILAFVASVSLTLLREQDRKNADIDLEEYWRSGISPGDWREIIARCSRVFATYEDNPLALGISRLNIRSEKKGFGQDIANLIRIKNDYKHDRGPTVLEDIAEASQEVQERLRRCMAKLSFFGDFPIRQVEDFNVSRSGDKFFLKCLRYMGDHPSFPQEEIVFHRGLPRGDLFLDLNGRDWMLLYPFIVTMICSHCKAKETYFIDLWDRRRGTALLKSFERGHTMRNTGVAEALAIWNS